MSGFLSNKKITDVRSKFDTLHNTFKKSAIAYKTKRISPSSEAESNQSHNYLYGTAGGTSHLTQEERVVDTVSLEFEARMYHINSDKNNLAQEFQGADVKIPVPDGILKIIVKEDEYDFIREADRVEIDGVDYSIESDAKPYGFTSRHFYIFYLKPQGEI